QDDDAERGDIEAECFERGWVGGLDTAAHDHDGQAADTDRRTRPELQRPSASDAAPADDPAVGQADHLGTYRNLPAVCVGIVAVEHRLERRPDTAFMALVRHCGVD